jgi:heme/copper-type cytochrome/quinol oxidase subunit 3
MSTAGSGAVAVVVERAGSAGVPSGTFGMVLFLATEAMFFAGLVSAYYVLRLQAVAWPPPDQPRLPVLVTGINTGFLLLSGGAMLRAVRGMREGDPAAGRWLAATAALGCLFLLIQGFEWVRLVGFGLTAAGTVYGATFYTLIGAHGLHVLAALVTLLVVTRRALRRPGPAAVRSLRLCAMVWTFVVAIWPVIYLLVYEPWVG